MLPWFSLHSTVRVRGTDREALERLCRYVARPPIALNRLRRRPDGLLEVRLMTPWRDGTTHLVLADAELVQRLVALARVRHHYAPRTRQSDASAIPIEIHR